MAAVELMKTYFSLFKAISIIFLAGNCGWFQSVFILAYIADIFLFYELQINVHISKSNGGLGRSSGCQVTSQSLYHVSTVVTELGVLPSTIFWSLIFVTSNFPQGSKNVVKEVIDRFVWVPNYVQFFPSFSLWPTKFHFRNTTVGSCTVQYMILPYLNQFVKNWFFFNFWPQQGIFLWKNFLNFYNFSKTFLNNRFCCEFKLTILLHHLSIWMFITSKAAKTSEYRQTDSFKICSYGSSSH